MPMYNLKGYCDAYLKKSGSYGIENSSYGIESFSYKRQKPKIIAYRNYKNFKNNLF